MTALAIRAGGEDAATRAATAACAHCGQPLADSVESFCCAGCASAYELVHGLGLGLFYRRRRAGAGDRSLRPEDPGSADFAPHAVTDAQNRHTLHLMIDGISCAACVWLIESVLAREPAVIEGRVNMTTRRLVIRWEGPRGEANRYAGLISSLGFRLVPFDAERLAVAADGKERELLRAIAVAGFAAANVMLLSVSVWAGHADGMGVATRDLLHWVSALIATPAIAFAGLPFFRSALAALRTRRTNMDVPISIGVLLATGMSLAETVTSGPHAFFDSAITLLFFLLVGRYLDVRARGRARASAEHLLSLSATAVMVVEADGTVAARPAHALEIGQTVLTAAGERIAVDGRVVEGRSDLDTSLVTGESVPAAAEPGSQVFAGTVNLTAPLRIKVTAAGEGTLLADIVRLMEAAERGRGRFVALADRVARAYAPVVHLLAAITFVGWFGFAGVGWQPALLNAVAVLIITCPCALALAVPVVQVVASGRLLRGGMLLKSATALERLAEVDTVVFDKTGTLTLGRPELQSCGEWTADDLRLAASLAQASHHPLARALVRAAPEAPVRAGVVEHPGRGLAAATSDGEVRLGSRAFCGVPEDGEGTSTELWLAVPGRRPRRFAFADRLRPDAAAIAAALHRRGLTLELLSGDRPAVVAQVARELGIEIWTASCTPAQKEARLAQLRTEGRRVLMVGDGLNDAPALAAADVSLSPATAADVSQTAADAVFQGDRLAPVVEILEVARRAARLVRQNIAIAIAYNALAVPLAMAGFVTPLLAAVAMSSSSVLVIANALRLARRRG